MSVCPRLKFKYLSLTYPNSVRGMKFALLEISRSRIHFPAFDIFSFFLQKPSCQCSYLPSTLKKQRISLIGAWGLHFRHTLEARKQMDPRFR